MLNIVVHPSLELFHEVHAARLRAKDRIQRIQELIFEGNPFWPPFLSQVAKVTELGFGPAEAVGADSYYAVRGHQVWGAMNPLNSSELQLRNTERLLAVDWQALATESVASFPWKLSGTIELFLVPGDPHNPYFMVFERGLSIFSLVPGKLLIALWPHPDTFRRLRAQLPGEILANQFLQKEPLTRTSTLLEHWFALSLRKIGLTEPITPDIESALCEALGVPAFEDIPCNIFGPIGTFKDFQCENPPDPDPETIALYLDFYGESQDPGVIAGFLYGDPYLKRAGRQAEGFPQNFGSDFGRRLLAPLAGAPIEVLRRHLFEKRME